MELNVNIKAVNAHFQRVPNGIDMSSNMGPLKAGAKSEAMETPFESVRTAPGYWVRLDYRNRFGSEGFSDWYISHVSQCKLMQQVLPPPQERV